jgi:hypothetical protein
LNILLDLIKEGTTNSLILDASFLGLDKNNEED